MSARSMSVRQDDTPKCPIHVGIRMARKKHEVRMKVGAKYHILTRTTFRCSVPGCPRVETEQTVYLGKRYIPEFLDDDDAESS